MFNLIAVRRYAQYSSDFGLGWIDEFYLKVSTLPGSVC